MTRPGSNTMAGAVLTATATVLITVAATLVAPVETCMGVKSLKTAMIGYISSEDVRSKLWHPVTSDLDTVERVCCRMRMDSEARSRSVCLLYVSLSSTC